MLLVLGVIKCGLYSSNEVTAKLCITLLLKVIEELRENSPNDRYDTRLARWFTKVVV